MCLWPGRVWHAKVRQGLAGAGGVVSLQKGKKRSVRGNGGSVSVLVKRRDGKT